MARKAGQEQMPAYSEAVKSGLYEKRSGLVGKYDNVRRYWEDELTRIKLCPYLREILTRRRQEMKRLRIVDLGCGSADGYELLSGIRQRDADLKQAEVDLLSDDMLGIYKGVDLNDDLLDQARTIYGQHPKMTFETGDFTNDIAAITEDDPYDLYFTSFGTFSHHNDDETAIELLAKIAAKVSDYGIIVCDWLGRYSYEWQQLWTNKPAELPNMDYVVSYIYEKEEREQKREQLQHLTLRLMSRPEAEHIIQEAGKRAGVSIKPLEFFDRSVFTGRHMDTQDYNAYAQPLRAAVNSLHETNLRTDFSQLLINYVPKNDFDFLNHYFEHLQMCWNTLIHHVNDLVNCYDPDAHAFAQAVPEIPVTYPRALQHTMEGMTRVIKGIGWLRYGLPRENIIEPQLGFALRYLISELQQGRGCGHGLIGVLEVTKDGS